MTTEIKDCPFCGSSADVQSDFGRVFWVQCTELDCGATDGTEHKHESEAVENWNRRPALAASGGNAAPELPEPLEINWPTLNRQALGCGVEDRSIHCRYSAAEYGWEDGVDRAIECVPEAIYDADQMREYGKACAQSGPNAALVAALQCIARWHGEFPPTGKTWADGTPTSYATEYGSNGERDYMRQVALDALFVSGVKL